jgi:hypothetical protein
MDFIEQIFHVAPDGGSGHLEIAIVLLLVVAPLAVLAFRKYHTQISAWATRLAYGDQRRSRPLGASHSQRR